MANILVVVSSAREGRVGEKILPFVTGDLEARDGVTTTVADLQELDLPFVNSAVSPADPAFEPTDERVIRWTNLVGEADGIVFLTPEYNHAINGIQKNALDWIKKQWADKPVSLVGYGWGGASFALDDAKRILEFVGTKLQPTVAQFYFTKQIGPDGSILDEEAVKAAIKAIDDELVAAL